MSFPLGTIVPAKTMLNKIATSKEPSAEDSTNVSNTSFMSMPTEIRKLIYEMMVATANKKRLNNWYDKPTHEFSGLMTTCKALYDELCDIRPQVLVSSHNFAKFYRDFAIDLNRNVPLKKYRSLTIQLNLNASSRAFQALTDTLYNLRDNLEELHLSFTGVDGCGAKVYPHGCAYHDVFGGKSRLYVHGQRRTEMLTVAHVLQHLTRLRILVLSNLNAPLFQGIVRHMPKLNYLHITTDPRSVLHHKFSLPEVPAPLFLSARQALPIKALHITANSMMNAFELASSCALHIEHLTWTIPGCSSDWNHLHTDPFQNTEQLMLNLVSRGSKIKVLRICIQGDGLHGDHPSYNHLSAATGWGMGWLKHLTDYEVHVANKVPWHGAEVLRSLPKSVKRFYANSRFVTPYEIYKFVTETYLSDSAIPPQNQVLKGPPEDWTPQPQILPLGSDCDTEHCIDDCYRSGIIGEDFRRKDFIPLRNGDLKFISYEFDNPEYMCRTCNEGETLTQMMLRLNGRLLDRERNKHLSNLCPLQSIAPRIKAIGDSRDGTRKDRKSSGITVPFDRYQVTHQAEVANQERAQEFSEELSSSTFKSDRWKRYFGEEDGAWDTFVREKVAKPEELPPLTYPYYFDNDCHDGEGQHECCWMCPEPYMPTLTEIDNDVAGKQFGDIGVSRRTRGGF